MQKQIQWKIFAAGNYKLWQKTFGSGKKLADPDIQRWLRGLKEEVCTEMSALQDAVLIGIIKKITVRNKKKSQHTF